ncbi:MAG TPA: protein kinase [Polyangiaceae bacterium]|nr:protein kinase [Polyangiaceae bacterium]
MGSPTHIPPTEPQPAGAGGPDLRPGQVLSGKYRIEQVLGAGAMGFVLAAHHLTLDRRVAIKFPLPATLSDPGAVARFIREGRAAVRIESEHIARVFDVGQHESGAPYLVMEFLEGADLSGFLKQGGPLTCEQTVEFVLQICEALAEAHALGIVHRDLKPANLFVIRRPDGLLSIKVLDFGISKYTGAESSGLAHFATKTGAMIGSPFYMSPEQWSAPRDVDARADIWALGVIMYEVLAGAMPFAGETVPELFGKIATGEPPPVSTRRADTPRGIEAVIAKCLKKDRAQRYSNVAELALALAPFGSARSRASAERTSRTLQNGGQSRRPVAPMPPPGDVPRVSPRADPVDCSALVARFKLFVDETFLLDERGRRFLVERLLPAFERRPDAKLILPARVHERLSEHARGDDPSSAGAAKDGLAAIEMWRRADRLVVRGEANEVSGETAGTSALFVRLVYKFQLKHELAFLTLDATTAHALLATNRAESIERAKPVTVLALDAAELALVPWEPAAERAEEEVASHPHAFDVRALVAGTKVVIDTSSLMAPAAEVFVKTHLVDALTEARNKIIVDLRVIQELERHTLAARGQADKAAEAKAAQAKTGLTLFEHLRKLGLVDLRESEHDVAGAKVFFDALIEQMFVRYQKSHSLVLITQDRRLAQQVLENARNLDAVDSVRAAFINDRQQSGVSVGGLGNWQWRLTWAIYAKSDPPGRAEPRLSTAPRRSNDAASDAPPGAPRRKGALVAEGRSALPEPFRQVTEVWRGSTERLAVTDIPGEGRRVIGDRSGAIQLTQKLAEGGEGAIFDTSLPDTVCKIYFPDHLTAARRAKLELMTTREPPAPTICWPRELVRNEHGEFVGYLMARAKGEIFNLTVFKKPLLEENFPDWGRAELVELSSTTLDLIRKLHAMNVIIGDINPNNFMVVSAKEVYLVDTDSFQVEGFPCTVGTPHFTPPELIGVSYGDVLRTKEHEVFAVATLLFMILLPGKPPYSGQGGGDIVENIRNHKFPYVTDEGERSAKPFGPYKFIWSHLHPFLKRDFREIFYDGRRTPRPGDKRKDARGNEGYVAQFARNLKIYADSIRAGHHSNELFPSDNFEGKNEAIVEIPCAEPGCSRFYRVAKDWHEDLLARGQKVFQCSTHFEINRLRRETRQVSREMGRPLPGSRVSSSTRPRLVDVTCAHCSGSDKIPPSFHAELTASGRPFVHRGCKDAYFQARRRARSGTGALFGSPPSASRRHRGSPRPAWVIAVAVVLFLLFVLLSAKR